MIVKNLNDLEFITYGIEYDPAKFQTAENRKNCLSANKPLRGLWSSPTNSEWGWRDWCSCENFRTTSFNRWTKFKLTSDAKIIVINSFEDFKEVLARFLTWDSAYEKIGDHCACIDFEKMIAEGYDGVFLTDQGNAECHLPSDFVFIGDIKSYSDLNTWDCESMVLFKNDKIRVTEIRRD